MSPVPLSGTGAGPRPDPTTFTRSATDRYAADRSTADRRAADGTTTDGAATARSTDDDTAE